MIVLGFIHGALGSNSRDDADGFQGWTAGYHIAMGVIVNRARALGGKRATDGRGASPGLCGGLVHHGKEPDRRRRMEFEMKAIAIVDIDLADGTGAALQRADVLIRDGRIERIYPAGQLPIDDDIAVRLGTGLVLAPGFIDVHSHTDNASLLDEPDLSKIMQGVTTEVIGNCGFSLAPRGGSPQVLDDYLQRIFPPLGADWHSTDELFHATDNRGYVTNIAPLVGHHALRILAMNMANDAPSVDQSAVMAAAIGEAVQAGVFGLSTGLIYPPGMFSSTEEIIALVRELPENAVYATHMRGEGQHLPASIAEAIRIGHETGRRVQVSHLKSTGRPHWGAVPRILAELDRARAQGVDIRHDVYPYTASSTMLTALLPPWFQVGGNQAVLQRLADEELIGLVRAQIAAGSAADWENMVWGAGWENIVLAGTSSGQDEGRSLAALASAYGGDPFDALVAVLTRERLRVTMTVHQMNDDDLLAALVHPMTMIGSDGLPPGTGGKPHPRMFGTFPRVIAKFCREQQALTLVEAIRKMTSLPADMFGLPDRGRVQPGAVADLVAFNPATIADQATYDNPTRTPIGIDFVMQAGTLVVDGGSYLGGRHGSRLRPLS